MTYIVAFHPDATLKVEAVGPFRSRERAEAARDRLSGAIDSHHPDAGPTRLPHVVRLITEADAMEGYALRFGDEEAGS